jgi:hypothetical protein
LSALSIDPKSALAEASIAAMLDSGVDILLRKETPFVAYRFAATVSPTDYKSKAW